jgi:diadenosine tetraphosphate (Ap4A) HIT family hydrolase
MPDIFDDEKIIGASTITKVGTIRIVASKDADHEFHFLLIPIRHVEYFTELKEDEFKDMQSAESLIDAFYRARRLDGYSKIELVGIGAGRTVPHYHVHFIPGKSDNFHNNPSDRVLHRSADQIREVVSELSPEFERLKENLR